jgi:hypothetical protein
VFDYVRVRETARKLIEKFGKIQILVVNTSGNYDPETGTTTGAGTTNVNVNCAHFPAKGETNVNGTLIIAGDEYALVSGADANTVSVDDKLIIDDVTWNIFAVLTIGPADTNVLHKLYIRK